MNEALQIEKIINMEFKQSYKSCSALVVGESELAVALRDILSKNCYKVVLLRDITQNSIIAEKFNIIVLFAEVQHKVLADLAEPDALVVDARQDEAGEWIIHEKSPQFRRIRILSLIRK